uniref:Uncharacterized protein n=1 Tax=Helianthus annuus TaxID=4232 RepID=A0A251VS36_HELAN
MITRKLALVVISDVVESCAIIVLRGTWGKMRREKTKWLELKIRSLNKMLFKF